MTGGQGSVECGLSCSVPGSHTLTDNTCTTPSGKENNCLPPPPPRPPPPHTHTHPTHSQARTHAHTHRHARMHTHTNTNTHTNTHTHTPPSGVFVFREICSIPLNPSHLLPFPLACDPFQPSRHHTKHNVVFCSIKTPKRNILR